MLAGYTKYEVHNMMKQIERIQLIDLRELYNFLDTLVVEGLLND